MSEISFILVEHCYSLCHINYKCVFLSLSSVLVFQALLLQLKFRESLMHV